MNRRKNKAGFTLVEMLLAVSISVMVFFAMGTLLTKCFLLWKDATAHWRLAQYARISRERILCGGFADPSGGLLAATNSIQYMPVYGWSYVEYKNSTGGLFRVYGWVGDSEQNIWIYRAPGTPNWAYAQSLSYPVDPPVNADSFSISGSNDIVTVSYRLRLSAGGKTFTQPHTIKACLVNKED